jgi:photosystem II stability/assembly factor-like uncharacterized protein
MRTQSIRLALAIVLLCPFAPAQWMKTNGPYGGNVLCFAVSGTNIFAGTGWNGIYLSTNNGTSWTSVNSGLPQYTGVNALLVSGTNLFAGTDSGLFVSTDNGTGWTMDSASLSHIPVTALAMSGTNLFAGTLQGVFVSTDNGISWIQSYNTPSSNVTRFAVTASSVFVTDSGFVFRSTNGGSSWTSVSKGLPQYVRSVSGLYAAFSQVYVVVSYEYCDGCSGTAVCRSTDNGENWTTCGIPIYDILLQHYANLLAATSNGVLLSTDQGTSWAVVSNGLPQSSIVNALAVSGTNIFAAIPVSGVFLSTNNGTSWAAVNNGLTTTIGVGALAFSGTNLFAGTDGGGVHLSTDNGRSWTAKTGLTNIFVTALAVSGTNLFAATGGGIFLSTDNGSNWTAVNTGLPQYIGVDALAVCLNGAGGTNVFAATTSGVFLSTNNGASWTRVDNGGTLTYVRVNAFAVSGTNLFAGTSGGIFLSTDNGSNWTAVNTGLPQYTGVDALVVCLNGAGGTNVFAATTSGVFLSTNNGASWTAVNTGLTNTDVWSLAMNGPNLLAGTSIGVFLSTNNGTSWTAYNTGLPQAISVFTFAFSSTDVFAATGYGVWRRPLSEFVSVQSALSVLPNQFDLAQNYPNPFNPNTTIKFQLPHSSWVSLKVYNTLGQEVAPLVGQHKDAGYYQVQWDASKVPSGIYFYRLQTGNFVETKKMVLLK